MATLNHNSFECAITYDAVYNSIIPILFILREHSRFRDIDSLIAHTLLREFQREIPASQFWEISRQRKLLLLLDGFDEMLSKTDKDTRLQQFFVLSKLLTSGSPAILTCRPSYFVDDHEYSEGLSKLIEENEAIPRVLTRRSTAESDISAKTFDRTRKSLLKHFVHSEVPTRIPTHKKQTIWLNTLDATKIDEFLKRRDSDFRAMSAGKYGWSEVRAFLDQVYDLTDLMTRPILLDMIVETVMAIV